MFGFVVRGTVRQGTFVDPSLPSPPHPGATSLCYFPELIPYRLVLLDSAEQAHRQALCHRRAEAVGDVRDQSLQACKNKTKV